MEYKSYYECKRCFHKFTQKIDIKRHLDNKKLCTRTVESFTYKDEELYSLSLKINAVKKSKTIICEKCNKVFYNKNNLNRHILASCKPTNIVINNNVSDSNNVNITINNININVVKSFDEEWDTTLIDNKLKLILLLNDVKFTSTLENILENEVNLNVLIDNTTNTGIVVSENKFKNMNVKEIVNKTMKKLIDHISNFHKELSNPNIFNINKILLDGELHKAQDKYNEYIKDINIQKNVNAFITNMYNKKKEDTVKNYINFQKEGF
jgi:hypothetical protein